MEGKKICVVRVRGRKGINKEIQDTLTMLKLHNNNVCVLVNDTPSIRGMLKKAKDYITWGEVDDEVVELLKKKSDKGYYCLNPPKGGYGRKGIKKPFSLGGALGDRKEKINDLIKRMVQ